MKISQDRLTRTVHIDLGADTLTTSAAHDRIALHYDPDHNIVGIEILDVDVVELSSEAAHFGRLPGDLMAWRDMPLDMTLVAAMNDQSGKP